jgi:hypothetical protein
MKEFTYPIFSERELKDFDCENGMEKLVAYLIDALQRNLSLYNGETEVEIKGFSWRENSLNGKKKYLIEEMLS